MDNVKHLNMAELEAGLEEIRRAPKEEGALELIVQRPEVDGRVLLDEGQLDVALGLVGDNWQSRGTIPDMQLNLMNSRAAMLVAQSKERWPLAGDQFYVDLDLSDENLPPGTQLAMGSAIVEVTAVPHLGCKKFTARFGVDAMKFVNSTVGKPLNLRGICAKVVQSGTVQVGDVIRKM